MLRPWPVTETAAPSIGGTSMLTLYFAPGSSSMAAHIALHEVGAAFESRPLSFARKETGTPAFLAINPEGKVPTLLIDGRPLTEVAGILFWLAKRFPEAKLLPRTGDAADNIEGGDIEAEAQAVSGMAFIAAPVHPAPGAGPAWWAIIPCPGPCSGT